MKNADCAAERARRIVCFKLEVREETRDKREKQLADFQDAHSQEICRCQSLFEQQETEMAELTDRLRIFAVAGRQNEQIGVDTDTTAAYAEAPVAGAEVTEADATATGVRTRSPTMPDALSGGEESLNREAVIPPLVSLRSPVLCNPLLFLPCLDF